MPGAVLLGLMFIPAVAALAIAAHSRIPFVRRMASGRFENEFARQLIGRFREPWLLVLLPLVQLAANIELLGSVTEGVRFRFSNSLTLVILAIFLARNWQRMPRRVRSTVCVFVAGVIFNSIPRIVLGAMPYSTSTAGQAGIQDASLHIQQAGHVALTSDTNVWLPLADFIPLPGLRSLVSIGDQLMLVGLTLVIWRCRQWGIAQASHIRRDGPVELLYDEKGHHNDEIRTRS